MKEKNPLLQKLVEEIKKCEKDRRKYIEEIVSTFIQLHKGIEKLKKIEKQLILNIDKPFPLKKIFTKSN